MKRIINILLGILLLIALAYGANTIFMQKVVGKGGISATTTPTTTTSTKGGVTKNQDGTNKYVNNHYGIIFDFPSTYHLGSDELENGTLQLFNYDESVYKKGFGVNENKIEFHIGTENTVAPSSDYPEKKRTSNQITIGGQSVNMVDIELQGGQKIRSYFVPVPSLTR